MFPLLATTPAVAGATISVAVPHGTDTTLFHSARLGTADLGASEYMTTQAARGVTEGQNTGEIRVQLQALGKQFDRSALVEVARQIRHGCVQSVGSVHFHDGKVGLLIEVLGAADGDEVLVDLVAGAVAGQITRSRQLSQKLAQVPEPPAAEQWFATRPEMTGQLTELADHVDAARVLLDLLLRAASSTADSAPVRP